MWQRAAKDTLGVACDPWGSGWTPILTLCIEINSVFTDNRVYTKIYKEMSA